MVRSRGRLAERGKEGQRENKIGLVPGRCGEIRKYHPDVGESAG